MGGVNGKQVKALSEKEYAVDTIDLSGESNSIWDVKIYDEDHIPHPDECFFTS